MIHDASHFITQQPIFKQHLSPKRRDTILKQLKEQY
jgi:hypothetical protein